MKKILITASIIIASLSYGSAQDVITLKSGEDIQTKVLEVDQEEIKYKRFDNQNGPTYTLVKSDVVMIRYENGSKDIFKEEKKIESLFLTSPLGNDPFAKGQKDALINYHGYKGAATGTFVTSLLFPLAGLIPAIACSSTPPRESNLMYPSSELMKNQDYSNGYKQKARKIKSGKVWTNFGIGAGIGILAGLILSSASTAQ